MRVAQRVQELGKRLVVFGRHLQADQDAAVVGALVAGKVQIRCRTQRNRVFGQGLGAVEIRNSPGQAGVGHVKKVVNIVFGTWGLC